MNNREIFIQENLPEIIKVLEIIKKEIPYIPSQEYFRYIINDFYSKDSERAINIVKEDEILYKLEEWGAIEIKPDSLEEIDGIYYIKIFLDNFKILYDDLIKKFNVTPEENIQEKIIGRTDNVEIFNANQKKNIEMHNLLQKIKYEANRYTANKNKVNNYIVLITHSQKNYKTTFYYDTTLFQELKSRNAIKITDFKSTEIAESTFRNGKEIVTLEDVWGYEVRIIEQKFSQLCEEYEKKIKKISNEKNYVNQEADKQIIKNQEDIIIKLQNNELYLNKATGKAKLGEFKTEFNPISKEFKILLKLCTAENFIVRYEDLLEENISITAKRNLSFVIRNIKTNLGILPKKTAKNKDCIKNMKGHGYRLIT